MPMPTSENLPYDFADQSTIELLKQVANLRDFLHDAIPVIAPGFDFNKVEIVDPKFVLEDWRGRESDLFFRIPWSDGSLSLPVLICVLIEHQSRPDVRMSLRMLLNAVLFWDREWKAWEALPSPRHDFQITPIIPIVFHTGTQLWNNVKSIGDLFSGPELFKVFAPTWKICMWDLAAKTPQGLLSSTSYWLKTLAGLRAGSDSFDVFETTLAEVVAELDDLKANEPIRCHDLKRYLYSWCLKLRDANEHQRVLDLARKFSSASAPNMEFDEMPSIADSLLEKGWTDGVITDRREMLELSLLERFDEVPTDIHDWIESTTDLEALKTAMRRAIRSQSLDEFRKAVLES